MNATVIVLVFHWTLNLQHTLGQWWASSADYWQPSALDPCSTCSQTSCSYSRRKPKSLQGFFSTQNLDEVQEWKSARLAVWPRFLHIDEQLRTRREGKDGLHQVRMPRNRPITYNEGAANIVLIMCYIGSFITEKGTTAVWWYTYSMFLLVHISLTRCIYFVFTV